MGWFRFPSWVRACAHSSQKFHQNNHRRCRAVRPRLELLEDRLTPSSSIIDNFQTNQAAVGEAKDPATAQLTSEQRTAIESVVRASTNQIWFEQNVGQLPQAALYGFRTTFGSMLVYQDHLQLITVQSDTATGIRGQQVVNIAFPGSAASWTIVPGGSSDVGGSYVRPDGTSVQPAIYNELTLRNVYDGVDLRLYSANQGTLEFDWLVARAQDYQRIRIAATGQDGIIFNDDGSATLKLRCQDLALHIPESYQVVGGRKEQLAVRMVAGDTPGEIRYAVAGNLLNDQPLVIDPNVEWSTYFDLNDASSANGNPGFDSYLFAIAANANGVYCSGFAYEIITNGSFGNYMEVNAGFSEGTATRQFYIYRLTTDGLHISAWTNTGRVSNDSSPVNEKLNNGVPGTFDAVADLKLFPDGRVLEAFNSGLVQIYSADLATRSYSGRPVTMDTLNSVAIVDDSSFYASGRVAAAIPTSEIPAANIGPDSTFASTGALGTEGVIVRYTITANTPAPDWATYVGGGDDEYFTTVALTPDKSKLVFATTTRVAALASYPALVNAVDVDPGALGRTTVLAGVLNQQATKPAAFDVLTFLGGTTGNEGSVGANSATCLVTASNTSFWVAGNTSATDLVGGTAASGGTADGAQTTFGGGTTDAFLSFLPLNGSAGVGFQSTYLGGAGNDLVGGIGYDPFKDRVFLFGTTSGQFPTVDTVPGSS